MFLGLTPLGVFHTAISLVALGAGIVALVRYREISPKRSSGRIYVATTIVKTARIVAVAAGSRRIT